MFASFLVVLRQVVILFILMSLGFASNKLKWLNDSAVKSITNIVLYFVTPCVILNSFQREMNDGLLSGLGKTALISFLIQLGSVVLAHLLIKDKDDGKERVLRYAVVFSNCGFMGIPLQQALLGEIGVFYGAVYIAVFNVIVWTYGVFEMSGRKEDVSLKKLIINPGILGTIAGVLIFVLQIKLPDIVSTPISYMAALNTPLPMIIIGYYIGNLRLRNFTGEKGMTFTDRLKPYYVMLLRLIVVPFFAVIIMNLFNVEPIIMLTCAIACSAPTAANTAMFAVIYNRDAGLGAQISSVATLISLVTIPLVVGFAQTL